MFNTIFPGSFEIVGQTHTHGNVMEQQPDRTRTISKYQQHHDLRSKYIYIYIHIFIYIYMLTHLQWDLCLYSLEGGDYGPIQYGNAVKQPVLIIDCVGAPKWFKTRDCLDNLCVAMARNINVELLSGKVYTLAVRPEMTIRELKDEVKVFHPSEDEITRILSTVEFVLHGEKLNDLQMTVSDSMLDSANLQVIFYVKPAIECVNAFGHTVKELRDVRIPSTTTYIQPHAFQHCKYLLRRGYPGVCDLDCKICF